MIFAIQPKSVLVGVLSFLVLAGIFAWVVWKFLKASDDPGQTLKKMIYSAIVLGFMIVFLKRSAPGDSQGLAGDLGTAMVFVGGTAVFGLILGALWAGEIGSWFARPFENLIAGVGQELEPQPFYAIAEAKRKRGDHRGAIADIRAQLEKFPHDYQGTMMIAEIQAEQFKDIPAAEQTILTLLSETVQPPSRVAFALNRLADWHLAIHLDPASARAAFVRITELCPNTEQATLALQRIAHLATPEQLAAAKDRPPMHLVEHEGYLGLRDDFAGLAVEVKNSDPATEAAQIAEHLELHPYDTDARERLAILYYQELHSLERAVQQLEFLVQQPHQPQRQVVRWLHLLADIHTRHRVDLEAGRDALNRILLAYPGTAAAQQAERRLADLEGELQATRKTNTHKLGTYDNDLGLKMKSPQPWKGENSG